MAPAPPPAAGQLLETPGSIDFRFDTPPHQLEARAPAMGQAAEEDVSFVVFVCWFGTAVLSELPVTPMQPGMLPRPRTWEAVREGFAAGMAPRCHWEHPHHVPGHARTESRHAAVPADVSC